MRHLQQLSLKKTRAMLQSFPIVVFNLLAFAIFLAFVDKRFMVGLAQVEWLKNHDFQRWWHSSVSHFPVTCCCTKTSPSSLHISSPRPVVHFLPRGPATGREDRWGILSQSQVSDPTGVFAPSELLLHTS